MKRTLPLILIVALVATAHGGDAPLAPAVTDALTAIDEAPTSAELTAVFGGPALPSVVQLALGNTTSDVGIQLRAIHALAQYTTSPSDQATAHDALSQLLVVPRYQGAETGNDLLILRAAVEVIGVVGATTNPEDVIALTPFLAHPSRDIRTAAARGMRDLGFPAAVTPLRAQYAQETVPQVQLAISEALRVLD